MRKKLLWLNEILYIFIWVVLICYILIDIGRQVQIAAVQQLMNPEQSIETIKKYYLSYRDFKTPIPIAIYGIFWLIARCMRKEDIFVSGKGCLAMAVFTMCLAVFPTVSCFRTWAEGPEIFSNLTKWFRGLTFLMCAILSVVSLVVIINYLICAIQIRKENKAVGWKD